MNPGVWNFKEFRRPRSLMHWELWGCCVSGVSLRTWPKWTESCWLTTTPWLWASFFSLTFDAESFQVCIKLKNSTTVTHKCSTQIQQPVVLYQISCFFSLTPMQAFCNIACRGVSAAPHGPFSALFAFQTSFNLCVCSPELQVPLGFPGGSWSHLEPSWVPALPVGYCPWMCSVGLAILGAPREQVQLLATWLRTCPWTTPGQALGGHAWVSPCPGLHGQVVAVSSVEAMGWLHGFRGLSLSPVTFLLGHSRTQKDLTGSQGCLCHPALEDTSGGPAPASPALIIPRDRTASIWEIELCFLFSWAFCFVDRTTGTCITWLGWSGKRLLGWWWVSSGATPHIVSGSSACVCAWFSAQSWQRRCWVTMPAMPVCRRPELQGFLLEIKMWRCPQQRCLGPRVNSWDKLVLDRLKGLNPGKLAWIKWVDRGGWEMWPEGLHRGWQLELQWVGCWEARQRGRKGRWDRAESRAAVRGGEETFLIWRGCWVMITSSVKACCVLCRSSWGIVAKHRRPGGLNARHLWSHSSGGQMSQVKLSTGFVSSEAPLLGMQAALLLLYLHITFPVCVSVSKIPLSIRTPLRLA